MGRLVLILVLTENHLLPQKMKLLLTLALFATLAYAHAETEADAAPEADALFWGRRRYYGYSRPYYGHGYFRGKRDADAEPLAEAEAEPEADPLFFARRYYSSPRYY